MLNELNYYCVIRYYQISEYILLYSKNELKLKYIFIFFLNRYTISIDSYKFVFFFYGYAMLTTVKYKFISLLYI